MKNTILSERESILLEKIIIQYGLIVSFEQIVELFPETKDRQSIRKLVSKFTQNGWLVRIKKGLYSVANLESRGFLSMSTFKIAQLLVPESYISFESSLQHFGMYDQMQSDIVSISLKQHQKTTIQDIHYVYVRTKSQLFFGWNDEKVEDSIVKIAKKEKAILDILAYRRNDYSVDLIIEKMIEFQQDIDFLLLQHMAESFTLAIQRIIGFLLDYINQDSTYIFNIVKRRKGVSFLTHNGSNQYNVKWHLYYNKQIEGMLR